MATGMTEADSRVLRQIQSTTEATLRDQFARDYNRAALIDFPRHKNAGDSLIYSGERAYLKALGVERAYTVDINRYIDNVLRTRLKGGVVLFHGGGNLGDVWPEYQAFREFLIPGLRNERVVILPQSIKFRDPKNAERANRIFAEHGNLTLMVRDQLSMQRAAESLPDVHVVYCPDMAFGNGPLSRVRAVDQPFVFISRQDHEKQTNTDSVLLSRYATDWETGMSRADRIRWMRLKTPGIIYKRVPSAIQPAFERVAERSLDAMADLNLRSAMRMISRGKVLITDRLHAHVLATLMGVPNIVLDNNYKKISAVFEEYSGGFTTANYAADISAAETMARQLIGRQL